MATRVEATTLVAATRPAAQPVGLLVVPRADLMVRAPALVQIDHDETVLRRIVLVVMATALILRGLRVMGIHVHHGALAIAPTLRGQPAMAILVHGATAIVLVALLVLAVTDPTLRVLRAMVTDPTRRVLDATVTRVHVVTVNGHIRRAHRATARARIARVLIDLMATSRAVSGSPVGESVVRSVRR